jgi:hypothetical protein
MPITQSDGQQLVNIFFDCQGGNTITSDHEKPGGGSCFEGGQDSAHPRTFIIEAYTYATGEYLGHCTRCGAPLISDRNHCFSNG